MRRRRERKKAAAAGRDLGRSQRGPMEAARMESTGRAAEAAREGPMAKCVGSDFFGAD